MAEDPIDEGGVMDDIVKRLEARFQDFSGVTIKWNGGDLFIIVHPSEYSDLGYKRVQTWVDNIIKSGDY
jgi:hypothetical protein